MKHLDTLPTLDALSKRVETTTQDLGRRLLALDQMIAVCREWSCQAWTFVPRRDAARWKCADHRVKVPLVGRIAAGG